MTAYLIHSLPLLMSAVQIFCGDKMAVVAHLVGLEQLGYETELGLTQAVRRETRSVWPCGRRLLCSRTILFAQVMKNDHSWRGMLIKDNQGDWGICVATWRGMKMGTPGTPGRG